MMVLYPPPQDFYRGPFMPVVGWVGLAFGIYAAAKSLRTRHVDTAKPRLPDTDSSNTGQAPALGWRFAVDALVGIYVTWSGVHRGLLSLVGLGVIGLSGVIGAMVARRYCPPWPR